VLYFSLALPQSKVWPAATPPVPAASDSTAGAGFRRLRSASCGAKGEIGCTRQRLRRNRACAATAKLADSRATRRSRQGSTTLAATQPGVTLLLAAGQVMHAWLGAGGDRAPMRAALIRFWTRGKVLRRRSP
jgi:hypothetical protein